MQGLGEDSDIDSEATSPAPLTTPTRACGTERCNGERNAWAAVRLLLGKAGGPREPDPAETIARRHTDFRPAALESGIVRVLRPALEPRSESEPHCRGPGGGLGAVHWETVGSASTSAPSRCSCVLLAETGGGGGIRRFGVPPDTETAGVCPSIGCIASESPNSPQQLRAAECRHENPIGLVMCKGFLPPAWTRNLKNVRHGSRMQAGFSASSGG